MLCSLTPISFSLSRHCAILTEKVQKKSSFYLLNAASKVVIRYPPGRSVRMPAPQPARFLPQHHIREENQRHLCFKPLKPVPPPFVRASKLQANFVSAPPA